MRRLLTGILLLLFAAPLLQTARSAPEEEFDADDQRLLFTVGATRAARDKIEEARMALSSNQTLRGLHAAQKVLDEMEDDFFLREDESDRESTLWQSAAEVVRQMLAGLTDSQRKTYEKLARPGAAPLLAAALRKREEKGLREVLLRYGASSMGVRAARVLADLALESGRTRDAARYAQEGLRYAPEDAGLWRRLIDAHAAGGDRKSLAALRPPPELAVQVGDASIKLAALQREALAALPEPIGRPGWPMWGGGPARNGQLPEETPMPNRVRWKERTDWQFRAMDRQRTIFGRRSRNSPFEERLQNLRPLQPVSDGRNVFVSDGRGIHAYDIYSGREAWAFVGGKGSAAEHKGLTLVRPGVRQHGRTSLERAFSPVVSGDLVIGTVEVPRIYDPDELQGIEITTYLPRRVLVALNRHTGALQWWMGEKSLEQLTLGKLSVVSVPVVAEGLVLAICSSGELIHDVDFLAFDVRTGALRWRRPLGTGQQELNLFGSPLKELAASPVAVFDGVAYASTGLGFVAAVDIRSGVPRWLASYEISPIRKVEYWYAAPVRMPRVAPSPPVVTGDLLLVAPTDGKHLHAYDRRTGRLIWRRAYRTNRIVHDVPGHFLGVVNDGRREVALLTDHELRARDVLTGDEAWHTRFTPERDRVIGRGAVAGTEVLVPTERGLQRFSLKGDGAYRGSVPWPEDSLPGNLLPLGRVLIMTTREEVQWFYDWAAIERDVARRRKERPDDPTILLEAGEIYLRGGGETERALKAFEEARRVARAAKHPEYEARALLGLFQTWIRAGDQRAVFPKRAIKAYREAMKHARQPRDFVLARMRIHHLLEEEPDTTARIKNLEALVEEAEDALGVFEDEGRPVPARAMTLFLLAREHLARDRPTEAVNALQRILSEEREARFPEGTAGDRARVFITEILGRTGTLPYRRHERRARELLAQAVAAEDAALLEQLLAEYPNASVVTDALLERGKRLAAAGQPVAAAGYLGRLLASASEDHRLVPTALATLAAAYIDAGALGAGGAALDRLARSHGRTHFRWEGKDITGLQFASTWRERIAAKLPPANSEGVRPDVLSAPLTEVHFERVGDEEVARSIDVAAEYGSDGKEKSAPLTLMMRGQELVAIDLRRAEIAWKADTGPCRLAAYADGTLVIAVDRAFRGLDARTGRELWRRDTGAIVRSLAVSQGVIFAYVQDLLAGGGTLRLLALDAFRGIELWSHELERGDYHGLRAWEDRVVLQEVKYPRTGPTMSLVIYDAFSGRRSHTLALPQLVEGTPAIVDGMFLLAGTDQRRRQRSLTALDLSKGALRWQKTIVGSDRVTALSADGSNVVLLREDGTLSTYAARDGARLHETRIFVGDRTKARPYAGTKLLLTKDRVTLMPRPPTTRSSLVAVSALSFDRRTGKLLWDAPYPQELRPSRVYFFERDGLVCCMIGFYRNDTQNALIRLIDAENGTVVQEIEPVGLNLARWLPTMIEGHGTLVIVGKTGASIFRGPK